MSQAPEFIPLVPNETEMAWAKAPAAAVGRYFPAVGLPNDEVPWPQQQSQMGRRRPQEDRRRSRNRSRSPGARKMGDRPPPPRPFNNGPRSDRRREVERVRIDKLLVQLKDVLGRLDDLDQEIQYICKEGTFINFGLFMNLATRLVKSFQTSDGLKHLRINFRDGAWYLESIVD